VAPAASLPQTAEGERDWPAILTVRVGTESGPLREAADHTTSTQPRASVMLQMKGDEPTTAPEPDPRMPPPPVAHNEEWSAEATDARIGNGAYAKGFRIKRDACNNYYGKESGWYGPFRKRGLAKQKEQWEQCVLDNDSASGTSVEAPARHPGSPDLEVSGSPDLEVSRSPCSSPVEPRAQSPEPGEGLLVFLGDSNCTALTTGSYRESEPTTEWRSLFGLEGKMPAINGAINGSVYGQTNNVKDLRCYLDPQRKRAVPKCGGGFKNFAAALAALQRSPRGLVYGGFKNHIGFDVNGSHRLEKSVKTECGLLISDVRSYMAGSPHLPIYLLELYQPEKQNAVDAINRAITQTAKEHDNVYVVKIASLEHLQARHASAEDKLHLTPEGYNEVLRAIAFTVDSVEQNSLPQNSTALLEKRRTKRERVDTELKQKATEQEKLNAPSEKDLLELEERVRNLQAQLEAADKKLQDGKNKRQRSQALDTEMTQLKEKQIKLCRAEQGAKVAVQAEQQAKEALKAAQEMSDVDD